MTKKHFYNNLPKPLSPNGTNGKAQIENHFEKSPSALHEVKQNGQRKEATLLQTDFKMQEQLSRPLKKNKPQKHFQRPIEYPFTHSQRANTTVLVGGLSPVHDHLLQGAMQNLGLKCKALPNTCLKAFQLGRGYGNYGYCNPTYFTSGNLILYLQNLHANGMSKQEIIDKYVFFTAGCNAPCRFGMIEAQYRLVLANAGFEGFRVLVFSKSGGTNQKLDNVAIDINFEFFLILANAFNMADLINALVFSIRPFEVEKGKTNRIRQEVMEYLHDVLKDQKKLRLNKTWKRIFAGAGKENAAQFTHWLLHQLISKYYVNAMKKVKEKFETIEVDRFRLKTIVKGMGEFWAQVTESDGNFNIYPFLEEEGAEIKSDSLASYLVFMFGKHQERHRVRKGLNKPPWWQVHKRIGYSLKYFNKYLVLDVGDKLFRRELGRLQKALGDTVHMLIPQKELYRLAHPYYNIHAEGGESYMEVAKNIYYHENDLCHMALSLKPFGCMPSTISDGVQVKVIEDYKDIIFLPLETSGEGEINAHSRVQMALTDARNKAKQELKNAMETCGKSLEEMKAYVEQHPELKNPMYRVPHRKGVIGTMANFVLHVAELMEEEKS